MIEENIKLPVPVYFQLCRTAPLEIHNPVNSDQNP